jgi:prepilin-type N-terminal cleavage/methylation domain-containing protein
VGRASERGFSLVEVLIATAIFSVVAGVALVSLQSFVHWNTILTQRQTESAAFGQLVDRLQAEEDSAWAIFTPPTDVFGKPNTDDHELDFFARDGQNRAYFWAYLFDSAHGTLQKYTYAAPGSAPTASGDPITGVKAFTAHTYDVSALNDPSTPIYEPIYANRPLSPYDVHFGFGNAVAGGNQITYVRIDGTANTAALQLSTQLAPGGWTVRLAYTPGPTGALHTLGKVVFEPGSLGGTTQPGLCDYAQLYLEDGSLDKNGADGFNRTDANGCVTNNEVRLWATESNYTGMFGVSFPVANGCRNFVNANPQQWTAGY